MEIPDSDENIAPLEDKNLDESIFRAGLGVLGKHPLQQALAFLQLNISCKQLKSLETIKKYPLLMYIDASTNDLEDLSPLATLQCLTQLNLR